MLTVIESCKDELRSACNVGDPIERCGDPWGFKHEWLTAWDGADDGDWRGRGIVPIDLDRVALLTISSCRYGHVQ